MSELLTPIQVSANKWTAKIQLDWLPLPAEVIKELGWKEGEELEILPIENNQVVIRKKDTLKSF